MPRLIQSNFPIPDPSLPWRSTADDPRGSRPAVRFFSAAPILQRCLQRLEQLVRDNVAIEARISQRLPDLAGSAPELEQLVFQLALRAIDTIPAGGVLSVEVYPMGLGGKRPRVLIAVASSPGAMPAERARPDQLPLPASEEPAPETPFRTLKQRLQDPSREFSVVHPDDGGVRLAVSWRAVR